MKQVALIGAGGHTRSLLNVIEANEIKIAGIYDDGYSMAKELINGYELKGKISQLPADHQVVLSIGDNRLREKYFKEFGARVCSLNLVHPRAFLEKNVKLGVANQILSGVYFNSNVKIMDNNILNSAAILEHEVVLGSHNHVSVGAIICGRTRIGSSCFIGAGSTIIDKLSICDGVIVGANSVVVENIDTPGVYVGCPARKIK